MILLNFNIHQMSREKKYRLRFGIETQREDHRPCNRRRHPRLLRYRSRRFLQNCAKKGEKFVIERLRIRSRRETAFEVFDFVYPYSDM